MKFRKKPVIIDAVLWTGENEPEIAEFMGANPVVTMPSFGCEIATLEGTMTANKGDWIIRGVKGEFYPCKPAIFEATYEAVE